MASRMERYYKSDSNVTTHVNRRSRLNEGLYQRLYDDNEYSNIEGIATLDKTNEIDITKIKEMLKNREEYNKSKDIRRIIKEPKPIIEAKPAPIVEEKNYDIRDILTKAKDEREDDDRAYRSLKNTQVDVLKKLHLSDNNSKNDELQELIDSINNTSLLNELEDRDLCLTMLGELKDDTSSVNSRTIRALLAEEREAKREQELEEDNMDHSFFTSSMNFNAEDFEDLKDSNKNLKRRNMVLNIVLFVSLVAFMTTLLLFLSQYF